MNNYCLRSFKFEIYVEERNYFNYYVFLIKRKCTEYLKIYKTFRPLKKYIIPTLFLLFFSLNLYHYI